MKKTIVIILSLFIACHAENNYNAYMEHVISQQTGCQNVKITCKSTNNCTVTAKCPYKIKTQRQCETGWCNGGKKTVYKTSSAQFIPNKYYKNNNGNLAIAQ